MGFLSPWFLAGLAAVGLPIWLHLLRKHRSTPLPFSSLMFFERRTQSSIKHRRLEHILLFALRTALLALIALAFAHPYIRTNSPLAGGGSRMVILAIDQSFSMRQGDRMERARSEALSTVGSLKSGDRAQVAAFAAQVHFLTQPSRDAAELRSAIQSIQPGDSRSSFGELARVLRLAASSARAPFEVHLFSDMQKASMPSAFADLRLPPGTRLVLHPAANSPAPNWVVENVNAPRRIYDPKKVRVQATVAGFATVSARRSVSLLLNNRTLETKDVDVPAGGRASVEFLLADAPYGLNRGEVRIDSADGLPQDDHFFFAVERADPKPVLFVHSPQDRRALLYFRSALEASPDAALQLEEVTADRVAGASPSKYALVVLSDAGGLPPNFEESLNKYVRSGGSVWVALGPASAASPRVPVLGANILETRYAPREGERFRTVSYVDAAHPSIRRADQWEGVKFYQTVRIDPGDARVLARLSDDTPVLLEKKLGEGRVLVFASTFDNISNDFPLRASFVPFVEQTAHYLGGLEQGSSSSVVDSFVELRAVRERATAADVIGPRGERVLSLKEATSATALPLTGEGFYELHRSSGRQELVAVNADRRESDLALIPPETLALWQKTGDSGSAPAGSGQGSETSRRGLWWYVILLALFVALAESFVANRSPVVAARQPEHEKAEAFEKGAA